VTPIGDDDDGHDPRPNKQKKEKALLAKETQYLHDMTISGLDRKFAVREFLQKTDY
jgi:hypothetical protein